MNDYDSRRLICCCSWYGWSADAGIHWIMPIIGYVSWNYVYTIANLSICRCGIFGFGLMAVFLPIQLYLVDS